MAEKPGSFYGGDVIDLPRSGGLAQLVQGLPAVGRRVFPSGTSPGPTAGLGGSHCVVEGGSVGFVARSDERAVIIDILGRNRCFCYPVQSVQALGRYDLIFLGATQLLVQPMEAYLRCVETLPQLSAAVVASKVEHHRETLRHREILTIRRPVCRVAGILTLLRDHSGDPCPITGEVRISLSQSLIAQAAHLSRQAVNRALRRLQAAGLLRVDRRYVCLLDPAGLEAVCVGLGKANTGDGRAGCEPRQANRDLACVRHS